MQKPSDIYKYLEKDALFTKEQVSHRLDVLAREIDDWILPGPATLVPIMTDGMWLCSEMLNRLRSPIFVNPYYQIEKTKQYFLQWQLEGKVLLITDVVDTGATLELAGSVAEKYGATEARILTLCHKGRLKPDQIYCHYVGFRIPRNLFIVGSGSSWCGLMSNLPGIRKIRQEKNER